MRVPMIAFLSKSLPTQLVQLESLPCQSSFFKEEFSKLIFAHSSCTEGCHIPEISENGLQFSRAQRRKLCSSSFDSCRKSIAIYLVYTCQNEYRVWFTFYFLVESSAHLPFQELQLILLGSQARLLVCFPSRSPHTLYIHSKICQETFSLICSRASLDALGPTAFDSARAHRTSCTWIHSYLMHWRVFLNASNH